MRKSLLSIAILFLTASCSSQDGGTAAQSSGSDELQKAAVSKLMCRVENQARCGHVIENRILFARFFAPETLGGMDENEKNRGRRITTRFITEAVAEIKQCQQVSGESISLVKDLKIAGGTYEFRGTSPLDQNTTACFLTQSSES